MVVEPRRENGRGLVFTWTHIAIIVGKNATMLVILRSLFTLFVGSGDELRFELRAGVYVQILVYCYESPSEVSVNDDILKPVWTTSVGLTGTWSRLTMVGRQGRASPNAMGVIRRLRRHKPNRDKQ